MTGIGTPFDEQGTRAKSKNNVAWMIIFTDLVSLMLTFFVLLFSMSTLEVDRWNEVINSLSRSLSPSTSPAKSSATSSFNIASLFRKRAINLDYLSSVLEEAIARDSFLASSRLLRLDDRLIIAVPGDQLFEPGKAVLSQQAQSSLFILGGVLRNIGNQIAINGHTDKTAPAGDNYSSNWELSMGRSAAVANALKRSGYSDDIIAFGNGSSRFSELPEMADEARNALARRMDIVVFPTVGRD